ncbi:zinc ribbon domain-containing protein [Bacteroidales bacterium OttesenSCG-928-L03]|nr:zinc ribbon domain-containing protein [Bacteroidales bacterium OttesenSCG-928-L03]
MKGNLSETYICQSCGMHLNNYGIKGTNADGSDSDEYCAFCYSNGSFIDHMLFDEMVEYNLELVKRSMSFVGKSVDEEETKRMLTCMLKGLKRWNQCAHLDENSHISQEESQPVSNS